MAAGILLDISFLIKLEDGYDRAFFDPNGQRDFTDGLDEGNGSQS